jgi:hypothetical protein
VPVQLSTKILDIVQRKRGGIDLVDHRRKIIKRANRREGRILRRAELSPCCCQHEGSFNHRQRNLAVKKVIRQLPV